MKNRTELAKYFAKLGFKKGAEVGVYKGYYSKVLLDNIPNLELLCVDNWANRRRRNFYSVAKEELKIYPNAVIIHKDSVEAAKDIENESLDFIFIDAAHDYENVKKDIESWTPKVKIGGIISGHDYYKFRDGSLGVITAVNEYVKNNNYKLELTEWNRSNPVRDDRQPCWWFVKKIK